MEARERPEREEAEEGLEGLDALRDRALEKADEENGESWPRAQDEAGLQIRPAEEVEAKDPQDERQSSEGLEELRERAPDPDEQDGQVPSSRGKVTTEAPATVEVEPRPDSEPASDQDVKLEDGAGTAQATGADDSLEAIPRKPPDGVQEELDREREAEESAGEQVGRHIPYENQVTVTEQEAPPAKQDAEAKLETEDLRRFPEGVETETEAVGTRTLEAVDYGKGAVLRVPKTDLERLGFDPEEASEKPIVELQLREHQRDEEEPKTVFARYVSSDRRAEAYVGGVGGDEGDVYEPVGAREYTEERFVKDFDRNKCEHFQNVKLNREEERLFVQVDGRSVELEGHRLSTSGHQAVLSGKLNGEADFKVEFDGRRESVRFGRGYPAEGMKMEGDELVVRYAQSVNEKHSHRMYLEHLEAPERPSLGKFDQPEMREHVKVLDHPERVEGVCQFVLDKSAQKEVRDLLDEAEKRGENEYGVVKAEISERLVPNMLELVGWERIKRHPFNETKKEGASANGTDWLVRTPDGKEAIMEVKWWEDATMAESRGTLQVADDFETKSKQIGPRIMGAYLAIMGWEINDDSIKVYVKRVRPEGELKW